MKKQEAQIYILDITDIEIKEYILEKLPKERAERIKSALKRDKAKQLYASYVLLGFILSEYGKGFDDLKINESGKPYLDGEGDLPQFNISHSGKYVAAAVGADEIGIDVQEKTKISDAAARMFLGDDISGEKGAEYENARIWCRKEAFLKCLGVGWSGKEARKISVLNDKAEYDTEAFYLTEYPFDSDYFLALCEKGVHREFEVKEFKSDVFERSNC